MSIEKNTSYRTKWTKSTKSTNDSKMLILTIQNNVAYLAGNSRFPSCSWEINKNNSTPD